ncbi:MAG: hypothetical protein AAF824_21245 [Bacteroidota bacterium]
MPIKTSHFLWHSHELHQSSDDSTSADAEAYIILVKESCDFCGEEILFSPLPSISFFSKRRITYPDFTLSKAIRGTSTIHAPLLRGPPHSCG